MKKSLLFITAVVVGLSTATAQNVVFEDRYESFDVGTSLTNEGYAVWEGTATVTDEATSGSAPANGSKYAFCQPGGNSFYLRKPLTLEVGKSYTFEVMTKSPAGNNHRIVARIGTRNVQSALINHTDWQSTSVNFTVEAGEEECVFWIYSFPTTAVHVDDFIVKEQGATAISQNEASKGLSVLYSSNAQLRVTGDAALASYSVFSLNGQAVQRADAINANELLIDLSAQAKGIYVIKATDVNGLVYIQKVIRR